MIFERFCEKLRGATNNLQRSCSTEERSKLPQKVERAQVAELTEEVQEVTGENVELAYVDQGYTGEQPAKDAAKNGIKLFVVKLEEAKRGFVLLPRRWVVERSFGWLARFRRLAKDYERLPETLRGLHFMVFAILMLVKAADILPQL